MSVLISKMEKAISKCELEELIEKRDVVLYQGLVLDVTKFMHPGGNELLRQNQGKDISSQFKATFHSLNAKLMLRDLIIGHIAQTPNPLPSLFSAQETKTVNVFDSIKSKFNPNQPIASQVSNFTREEFITFINYPKFIEEGQELEIDHQHSETDKTNFWVNIPILSVIWVILFAFSVKQLEVLADGVSFVFCFILAMFVWSAIEYYFHRVKLHRELDLAETADQSEFVKLAKSHLIHHAFPTYPLSIVIQLKTSIPALSLIFLTIYSIISLKIALFFATGLALCVIVYDCLHYFFHFGWEPTWPLIVKLKKNHLKHHYKNTNRGFGVTTTLWDCILGTQHL